MKSPLRRSYAALLLSVFAGALALLATAAHAADSSANGVGLLLGAALPGNASSSFDYGLFYSRRLGSWLVVRGGIERHATALSLAATDANNITTTLDSSSSVLTIRSDAEYLFPIGARTGLILGYGIGSNSMTSTDGTTTLAIDSGGKGIAVGLVVGYEHGLGDFALGGEMTFMHYFSSQLSGYFSLCLVAKYAF